MISISYNPNVKYDKVIFSRKERNAFFDAVYTDNPANAEDNLDQYLDYRRV